MKINQIKKKWGRLNEIRKINGFLSLLGEEIIQYILKREHFSIDFRKRCIYDFDRKSYNGIFWNNS